MDGSTMTAEKPRTLGFAVVPPERVPALAPRVMDLVGRACAYSGGRFDASTVLEACAGKMLGWYPQLWIAGESGGGKPPTIEAIAVTTLPVYPGGLKVMEVVLFAGVEFDKLLEFEPEFIAWGRRQGASQIQMIGRRGWARKLPDGWRETARMFGKPIEGALRDVAE